MERAALGFAGARFDVVHQHGIWTASSRVTMKWQSRYGRPTVVAPQGSLDSWALAKSRGIKKFARLAYEDQNLHRASCMHALSQSEADSIRAYGLRNPVAIIPNGVARLWVESSGDRARFVAQHGLPADARILLFLGRVTPKKGLPLLLEAISAHRDRMDDWLLVIAGPDEFGHMAELREHIERRDLARFVRFVGPIFAQGKRDAFAAAEVFVLPTYSEGAPIAVLEALGAGVPVLTTHGAPWEDIVRHDCGWWVPVRAAEIGEALSDALGRTCAELGAMGQRGRSLVTDHYSWESVSRHSFMLYQWLRGEADRPDFVIID
jgi:glycosyltransferase involved in cell wall biosynthesis